MHLTNWKASRAGAAITVTGTNEAGEAVKIVGVRAIEPGTVRDDGSAFCVAVDKSFAAHRLLI